MIDNDNINHPKHYNSSGSVCDCGRQIECIDVVRNKSFNIGNVIKYLRRYEHKSGIEDLKKARWYLNDEIGQLEKLTSAASCCSVHAGGYEECAREDDTHKEPEECVHVYGYGGGTLECIKCSKDLSQKLKECEHETKSLFTTDNCVINVCKKCGKWV